MKEISIDKGIPIPQKVVPRKYSVFGDFEAGDSAFFADSEMSPSGIAATVSAYAHRNGKIFTTRTVTENGVKGKRVWRIE